MSEQRERGSAESQSDASERLEAEILRHALRIAAEEASIVVVQSALA